MAEVKRPPPPGQQPSGAAPDPVVTAGGRVCAALALVDGGRGVRFQVEIGGQLLPAFAIRYAGSVHAYLNRCVHRLVELDWMAGEFFDADQRYLVCATHGALYDPQTGACADGPCNSRGLAALAVREVDGDIRLGDAAGIYLNHD